MTLYSLVVLLCQFWHLMDHSLVWAKWLMEFNKVMSHAMQGHPGQTGHSEEFWQNVVQGRREWQTIPVILLREPHEQYGKTEGKRRRGKQWMRWLDSITDSMDMNSGKLQMVRNRESWHAAVHRVTKSRTWLGDWTNNQTSYQFLVLTGRKESDSRRVGLS